MSADTLPCGHPAACVISSDEGTAYCGWCEDRARATAYQVELDALRRRETAAVATMREAREAIGAALCHDEDPDAVPFPHSDLRGAECVIEEFIGDASDVENPWGQAEREIARLQRHAEKVCLALDAERGIRGREGWVWVAEDRWCRGFVIARNGDWRFPADRTRPVAAAIPGTDRDEPWTWAVWVWSDDAPDPDFPDLTGPGWVEVAEGSAPTALEAMTAADAALEDSDVR